ncbi:PREDICTED: peroxisomal hydratase-dehydrogenase-epimerase-like [Papilio polytes]|uniref:peroxisomal hydratase-dehydrogenase-epimerase-like n=1 Tax=Papilio polytes TaxID=76194 RepID=UPI000675E9E7|nr:PREDICTED: peroxisomal hydratase-dehydrogenase-epimerase-like [Papilio polytes]
MYEVIDNVFLVTGGASGIGAGIVRAVLDRGAKHVVILDVDVVQGKALEKELNDKHGKNKAKFIECDITTQLQNAFDIAYKEYGYIDVVINNAGIMNDGPRVYEKEIAVNVTALITSTLKAFEWMRRDKRGKGGTIINISSIVGLIQTPLLPIYSATKSAVLQFSNCFGMEQNFKVFGVRVVTVCFGCTDTSLLDPQKLGGFIKDIDENITIGINKLPLQSVQSAIEGLLTAYSHGNSGSTWLVTSNRPAEEITENVKNAYKTLSQGVFLLPRHRLVIMLDIKNKVIIITGGANGIGAATVEIFLENGAKQVAVLDIGANSLFKLEEKLSQKFDKSKVKFIKCDVTKDNELYEAFDSVQKENDQIDVVINNAAIGQETMDSYKKLIEVNYTALVTSTLKALKVMRKDTGGKGGTIINISSVAALDQPSPSYFIYCGSKSAVLQFSNCIGKQEYYSITGVRVLTICFGATNSDMIPNMRSFDPIVDEKKDSISNNFPSQTVRSAAEGMAQVYQHGTSGDTWLVNNNKPAINITEKVKKAHHILSEDLFSLSVIITKSTAIKLNMEENFIFEGKVVVVTGGATGIGAGLIRSILSHNARHVTFLDLAERESEALERELKNKFGTLKVMFIKCDVSDEKQMNEAYNKVLDKFHRLDIVINNAAILSAEENLYKRMVDVNFYAVISSTLRALTTMAVDRGGSGGVILNVSSMLALTPSENFAVYSATKAAVLQFTNSIAINKSYSKSEVRVLSVCLGPTDTAILHKHNSELFDKGCTQCFTSRVPERQRVESAVKGIIDVIKKADNGSTWIIAGNKPPVDITVSVREGLQNRCNDTGISMSCAYGKSVLEFHLKA